MPVCIAGMHRSGTSLVARLLAASGVYGGPSSELVTPAPDNPEGFGESVRFLRLNDAVLARFGGFWDRPPAMPPGWTSSPRLSGLRRDATTLIARFRGREPWFWKDPRNSLTLAFWRGLIPDLRVVLCVRNPREVVASLERRDGLTARAGWALWLAYNRRVLAETPAECLVVTHYEAYLYDAPAELRRVTSEVGLAISTEAIGRACADVSLRAAGGAASVVANVPVEVETLYQELCAAAGPVYRRAHAEGGAAIGLSAERPRQARDSRVSRPARWVAHAARRVWRQEGVRVLGEVVLLWTRRAMTQGWDVFARIRPRRQNGAGR